MKKKITLLTLIIVSFTFGQVGINTADPKSIFEVSAKRNESGMITDNSQIYGLQAPRITRAELTNNTAIYGDDQQGALVYITDVSGGDALVGTPREFINSIGYYYYDSSVYKWQKINGISNNQIDYIFTNGLTKSESIIKLGGVLKEATIINQGDYPITFTGNVGIANINPTEKLDINGNIAVRPNTNGAISSINYYSNRDNKFIMNAPLNLTNDRTLTLPSNEPKNGYVLSTNDLGVTQWSAINPPSATLASISLKGSSNVTIDNGSTASALINQRFFQVFDTVETDSNSRFNLSTGTYTVSQSGIYLISAYIMPNQPPSRNSNGFFYPINLEVRKNCNGNPYGGLNIMDSSVIRYYTPGTVRFSLIVTGMVSLNSGDMLNLVVYLNGYNASASATNGNSFPDTFTYANVSDYKALFSVTAL